MVAFKARSLWGRVFPIELERSILEWHSRIDIGMALKPLSSVRVTPRVN